MKLDLNTVDLPWESIGSLLRELAGYAAWVSRMMLAWAERIEVASEESVEHN